MGRLRMTEGFDVSARDERGAGGVRPAVRLVVTGGRVALLGLPARPTLVDWNKVIFKQLTLKGIYGREMFETWHKMIAMLESGLDVRKVITHRLPAARFLEGFEIMRRGDSGKIVLDWDRRPRPLPAGRRSCCFGDRGRARLELQPRQPRIEPVRGQQRRVGSFFDDHAAVDDQDAGGVDDGRQPMGDDERGAAFHEPVERLLDQRLVGGVERRGRLVEQQHGGVFEDGAGDGDSLPLAAREVDAALAEFRVVALRQRFDEQIGGGAAGGGLDFGARRAGPAVGDVVGDVAPNTNGSCGTSAISPRKACGETSRTSTPSNVTAPEVTS